MSGDSNTIDDATHGVSDVAWMEQLSEYGLGQETGRLIEQHVQEWHDDPDVDIRIEDGKIIGDLDDFYIKLASIFYMAAGGT